MDQRSRTSWPMHWNAIGRYLDTGMADCISKIAKVEELAEILRIIPVQKG
jgi:hypothetical protein